MLTDIKRSLGLLTRRDQRVLLLLVFFQVALAILDVAAIAALGVVASLAAASATGEATSFLPVLSSILGNPPKPEVVLLVALGAGLVLILKSALSFWGTRRAFRFLANRQAMVASKLANELLSRPLLQVQRRSSQENSHALTQGVHSMTVGILGQSVIIASEVALVAVLLSGLLVVDPILTIFTATFFGLVAGALHLLLSKWAVRIGQRSARANAASLAAIQESLTGYREVTVSGRRGVYTNRFHDLVWEVARVLSDQMMIGLIGKYVFEIALIVGAGLLVLNQLFSGPLVEAAAVIVVFFAAASRIMPALLRLQSATLNLKIQTGTAQLSRELIGDLAETDPAEPVSIEVLERMHAESTKSYPGFVGELRVNAVSLTYPGAGHPALSGVSLRAPAGTSLALVGATGAGKSSLADLILGVIAPEKGDVFIGDRLPDENVRRWPGSMAYIPQDISIVNGTVRDNVAMGLPEQMVHDDRVWEALERARLADFLISAREELDTIVGEQGVKLSGGQRQRLGIARALYTRPRLLVMDEATSALDAETEAAVTDTFSSMSGDVTLVIIAHRLATIRNCEQVAYLDEGRLIAVGSFADVRGQVPDFDRQAQLLGL